jgi:hypothetical protein
MVVPSPRWHGIAGNSGAAKVRHRLGLAMVGFCHVRPTRIFRRSRLGYISRVQQPVRSAHPAWHVPRGPGHRDCAPHSRSAAATATRTGPASTVTGPARGRGGDWELRGGCAVTPAQPPRHRHDRRRVHRAGQASSPPRHGLVTAGAAWCWPRLVTVTVRLGCFAGLRDQKCGLSLQESMQTIPSCDGYLRI